MHRAPAGRVEQGRVDAAVHRPDRVVVELARVELEDRPALGHLGEREAERLAIGGAGISPASRLCMSSRPLRPSAAASAGRGPPTRSCGIARAWSSCGSLLLTDIEICISDSGLGRHMQWQEYESESCSIARALESLGDRWTVLILRDLFNGVHRFDELLDHLGVSRGRPEPTPGAMVEDGIVERRPYPRPAAGACRLPPHRRPAGAPARPHRAPPVGRPAPRDGGRSAHPARARRLRRRGRSAAHLQRGPRRARWEVANRPQAGARRRAV